MEHFINQIYATEAEQEDTGLCSSAPCFGRSFPHKCLAQTFPNWNSFFFLQEKAEARAQLREVHRQ